MRRVILVAAAVVLAGIPAAVLAGSDRGGGRLNQQSFAWTNDEITTASNAWRAIDRLRVTTVCPTAPDASAHLSVQLATGNGAAQFRVVRDGVSQLDDAKVTMPPGIVTAETGPFEGSSVAGSFTLVKSGNLDSHGENFRVQWRSPSGTQQVLQKATLVVHWSASRDPCL